LIKFYQYMISPFVFGNSHCRFHPSCSQYALEAFEKFSIPKALWLTVYRLSRCQPFCEGGYDPVPTNQE
jgi:putative membrane protein insertion efficiency factor